MTGISGPLSDLDPNRPLDNDIPIKKSRMSSTRRVSFADTFQIKEFQKDSPHRWQDEEKSPESTEELKNESGGTHDNQRQSTSEIAGLDKLLTGTIQNFEGGSSEVDVKELPLPTEHSLSVPSDPHNHTMYDNTKMDMTGCYGNIYQPGDDGFGDEEVEIKIDPKAFLQSLTKSPDVLSDGTAGSNTADTQTLDMFPSTTQRNDNFLHDLQQNQTIYDNFQMELTGCLGNGNQSVLNDMKEDTEVKIDGRAFLQKITKNIKMPSDSLSEMDIFMPQKQFSPDKKVLGLYSIDSETDVQTINNTSINKYTSYSAALHTVTDNTTVCSTTDAIATTKRRTSSNRLPLMCISDKSTNKENETNEPSQNGNRTLEDFFQDNGQEISHLSNQSQQLRKNEVTQKYSAQQFSSGGVPDATLIFHQDNDMECTEVVSCAIKTNVAMERKCRESGSLEIRSEHSPDKTIVFDQCDMEQTEVIHVVPKNVFSQDGSETCQGRKSLSGKGFSENTTIYFGGTADMEETGVIINHIQTEKDGISEIRSSVPCTNTETSVKDKINTSLCERPNISATAKSSENSSLTERKCVVAEKYTSETALINIASHTTPNELLSAEEKTVYFQSGGAMEETQVVTGNISTEDDINIVEKVDQDRKFMTKPCDTGKAVTNVDRNEMLCNMPSAEEKTLYFPSGDNMEETQVVTGNIKMLNSSKIENMDQNKNDTIVGNQETVKKQSSPENKTVYYHSDGTMEETQVVTGKIESCGDGQPRENLNHSRKSVDNQQNAENRTIYYQSDCNMEETQGMSVNINVCERSTLAEKIGESGLRLGKPPASQNNTIYFKSEDIMEETLGLTGKISVFENSKIKNTDKDSGVLGKSSSSQENFNTTYFQSDGNNMEETQGLTGKISINVSNVLGENIRNGKDREVFGKSSSAQEVFNTTYFQSDGNNMEETQGLTGKISINVSNVLGETMINGKDCFTEKSMIGNGNISMESNTAKESLLSSEEKMNSLQSDGTKGEPSSVIAKTEVLAASQVCENLTEQRVSVSKTEDNSALSLDVKTTSSASRDLLLPVANKETNLTNLEPFSAIPKLENTLEIKPKSSSLVSKLSKFSSRLNVIDSGDRTTDKLPQLRRKSLVKLSSGGVHDFLLSKDNLPKVESEGQLKENVDIYKKEESFEAKVKAKIVDETLNKTVDVDKMNNTRNIHEGSTTFDVNDREGITDLIVPMDLLSNTTIDSSMVTNQIESTNTLLQMNTDSTNMLLGIQPDSMTAPSSQGTEKIQRQSGGTSQTSVLEDSTMSCLNMTAGNPSYLQSIREEMEGSLLSQASISKLTLTVPDENLDEVPEGPMNVETFCKYIQMIQPYWLTGLILTECRESIALKSVDCSDLKSVLEAQLVQKSFVESHKTVFDEASKKSESSKVIVTELDEMYVKNQPELFQSALSCTPDQRSKLSEQVTVIGKICTKLAKCVWKRTGCDALKLNLDMLKTKMNDLCIQTEELFQIKSSTDECLSSLRDVLDDLDTQIIELEHIKYPSETEISEWKHLQDNIQQKELEQISSEEEQSRCNRMKTEICNEKNQLEEDLLNLQSKSVNDKGKNNLKNENEEDLRERINTMECVCEWTLDEEMSDDQSMYFFFYEDSMLLEIKKRSSGVIESLQLQSLIEENAPPPIKMAHNLVISVVDCQSMTSNYNKMADLPKILHEISLVVCDVRSLMSDIDETSLQYLLSYDKSSILVELWSLRLLRKVDITFNIVCCHRTSTFSVHPSVTVAMGKFSENDILKQMQQVEKGPHFVKRLCQAVDLGAVSETQTSSKS